MDSSEREPAGKRSRSTESSSDQPVPVASDQLELAAEGPSPYEFELVKVEPGWESEESIDMSSTDGEPAGSGSQPTNSCVVKCEPEAYDQCESAPEESYDLELVKDEPDWEGVQSIDMAITDGKPANKRNKLTRNSSACQPELDESCDLGIVKIEPGWAGAQDLKVDSTYQRTVTDVDQSGFATERLSDTKCPVKIEEEEKSYQRDLWDYHPSDLNEETTNLSAQMGKKRFACDQCDYRAMRAGNLQCHMRTHTGERPFACDQCEYRAMRANHLKEHMRTHMLEKPFSCDQCDYRATRVYHLKRHIRSHTGEKPFTCDQCDYRSKEERHIKRHRRAHSGEKPFACDQCGYRSAQHSNLKRHLITHTDENSSRRSKINMYEVLIANFQKSKNT